jgi:hypothetical protein
MNCEPGESWSSTYLEDMAAKAAKAAKAVKQGWQASPQVAAASRSGLCRSRREKWGE